MLYLFFASIFLLNTPTSAFEFPSSLTTEANFLSQRHIVKERPSLLLYYTDYCPYSQKVLRYLQQIHKTIPMINLEGNSRGKDELLEVGGKLQVPCLIVDGNPIYESDAIIQWLSEHQSCLKSI